MCSVVLSNFSALLQKHSYFCSFVLSNFSALLWKENYFCSSVLSKFSQQQKHILFTGALRILTTTAEAHLVHLCSQNSHNNCRSTSCSPVLSKFSKQLQQHILFASALRILTKPADAHLVHWCSQFSKQLQKHILFAGALNSHNNCGSTSCSPVLSKFSHPEMTQCG